MIEKLTGSRLVWQLQSLHKYLATGGTSASLDLDQLRHVGLVENCGGYQRGVCSVERF